MKRNPQKDQSTNNPSAAPNNSNNGNISKEGLTIEKRERQIKKGKAEGNTRHYENVFSERPWYLRKP